MNRIVIYLAKVDACPVCGGGEDRRVRVELSDYGIPGFIPCPLCVDPAALQAFVGQFTDYLGGTPAPGGVA